MGGRRQQGVVIVTTGSVLRTVTHYDPLRGERSASVGSSTLRYRRQAYEQIALVRRARRA